VGLNTSIRHNISTFVYGQELANTLDKNVQTSKITIEERIKEFNKNQKA